MHDQLLVAGFFLALFGGAVIGYAARAFEERKIALGLEEDPS